MGCACCHNRLKSVAWALLVVSVHSCWPLLAAAEPPPGGRPRMSPIAEKVPLGSRYPCLTRGGDGRTYLCWLEPGPGQTTQLRFSVYRHGQFATPRTIAAGTDWFVNWADVPSIAALADGTLAAHWLARNGTQPYAYGVRVSCSTDGGQSWTAPFWLHDDRSACEHGFVSMLPQPGGQFLAIWLDGRAMESTGDTQLWSRRFDARGQLGKEVLIDKRVCSCCPTSITPADNGVLAVYRDRSAEEVRDISYVHGAYVHGAGVRWTRPRPCHVDGWEIPG